MQKNKVDSRFFFEILEESPILLSRLLFITEGKYWNQLKKFRVVLSSGSHETGGTAKKVTVSDSAKPGPHIHIFYLSQGSRASIEMGTKSEKVCMCVYVTLISPRSMITFGSNLIGCFLYMGHWCY